MSRSGKCLPAGWPAWKVDQRFSHRLIIPQRDMIEPGMTPVR